MTYVFPTKAKRFVLGNMGEQPVAECFTLYKYIGNKKKIVLLSSLFCILTYAIIYGLIHHIIFWLYLYFLNIIYFFKYSCTNIFHRRSLCTFYWKQLLEWIMWSHSLGTCFTDGFYGDLVVQRRVEHFTGELKWNTHNKNNISSASWSFKIPPFGWQHVWENNNENIKNKSAKGAG